MVGDAGAESLAAQRPLAHQVERPLSHPDEAHAMVDAPWSQPSLGYGEASALLAYQVVDRHPDIIEEELGMAAAVVVAEHRQLAH